MDIRALQRDETRLDAFVGGDSGLVDDFVELGLKFIALKYQVSEATRAAPATAQGVGLMDMNVHEEQQQAIQTTYQRMTPPQFGELLGRAFELVAAAQEQPAFEEAAIQAAASVGYWALLAPAFDLSTLQRGALLTRKEAGDFFRAQSSLLREVEAQIGPLPFARWMHSVIIQSGQRTLDLTSQ